MCQFHYISLDCYDNNYVSEPNISLKWEKAENEPFSNFPANEFRKSRILEVLLRKTDIPTLLISHL